MAKQNFAKESFTGMPTWAKGLIGVLVVGSALYIGYRMYKKASDLSKEQGERQQDQQVNNELVELMSKGQKPQLTKAQWLGLANKIHTAMDGWGTDNLAIIQAFISIPTYLDLLGVMQSYGVRTVSSGKGNPAPDFKGTMSSAMVDDMDAVYIQKINQLLTAKKIPYKF